MANFLDLPLEIREQIYEHLLLYPDPDTDPTESPSSTTSRTTTSAGHSTLHPAILAVSKQIHAEALPVLYARNTFRAHPSLLAAFPSLHARRPFPPLSAGACPGLRLVRRWHLRARLDCGPFWTAARVARAFSGARALTVEVSQSAFGAAGAEVLRRFEGVRGVEHVRVWGSIVALGGYVPWLEDAMRTPVGAAVRPMPGSEEALSIGPGSLVQP